MRWHQRFFWLLLLFLPTQLGLHFWPTWAGVLGRRVDYLAPTVYFTDILIFLIVVVWLVPRVIQMVRGNPKSKFLNPKQIQKFKIQIFQTKHLWVMAGVVFVAVNIFVASNKPVAIYKWLKVSEFVLLGWYIVRTKPKWSAVITPLSVGVLYSSILAIAQFILQHSVGGPLWWLGERTFGVDTPGVARFESCQLSAVSCQLFLRPYATFPHPNVLGGYLAVILPAIIQYSNNPIIKLSNRRKYYYFVTIALAVVALFLTFSRSAMVVGGAAIMLMIARRKQQVVSSTMVFFAFGIFFLSTISLLLTTNYSSESVTVRQQLNTTAIKIWQTSPLFGVGLGNFLVRLPEALPSRTIYFLQPVHNIYLLLLAETGMVGMLVLIWICWLLFYAISNKQKAISKSRNYDSQLVACRMSLVALLILGLVDHYPLTLQQGQLLLTILLGTVVSMRKSDQSETNPTNE